MIKVITTVGTSLFTNYMQKEVAKYMIANYDNCAIDTEFHQLQKENNPSGGRKQKKIIEKIVPRWIDGIQKTHNEFEEVVYQAGEGLNVHCCAEVQTLVELVRSDKYKGADLEIHLLCTDTALSQLAGQILEENIFSKEASLHPNIQVVSRSSVRDLQVEDAQKFEENGFFNLVAKVKKIRDEISKENIKKETDTKLLLNISGGYKALIPPLTIVGQLYDIPIVYLYESSDKLIEIDKMPFQFDMSLLEPYSNYFASKKPIAPKESIEKQAMEELVSLNLFKRIDTGKRYKKTIMGLIVEDYINHHYPLGKSVLGFYMEHKFYELYIEESDSNYDTIKRSYRFHKPEIDLFITTDSKDYIVCEVKSFNQINYAFSGTNSNSDKKEKKFSRQLDYQIKEGFLKEGKCPKEYHLLIYRHPYQPMKNIKKVLKDLQDLLQASCPSCDFKVFHVKTDYTLRSKGYFINPYQQFMSRKFTFNQSKFDEGVDNSKPNKKDYELVLPYTAFESILQTG